jgi:DNA-binding response OmpR family regulator
MRVLLVEDSVRLQAAVARGLRRSGYAVDTTGNGEEGLWMAASSEYDVVVLDLMLPGLDGLTVLRRLREQGRGTHVLILTARDAVDDRVRGLREGADDYLVKPFALEELLARVQALCRRGYQRKNPRIEIDDLSIDTGTRTARRRGQPIELTAREFTLLEYLALRQGQVVSRTEIEAHLYPDSAELMSNVVDSAICTLRKKITPPGSAPLIHTRRGMGYVLARTTA